MNPGFHCKNQCEDHKLRVGTKIRLTGTIERADDGARILPRVLFNGASSSICLDELILSHAEIISEPVTKKPSEIITEIAERLRLEDETEQFWAVLKIQAILEYLDSQASESLVIRGIPADEITKEAAEEIFEKIEKTFKGWASTTVLEKLKMEIDSITEKE